MKKKLGYRLALRHEGDFWNAYVAELNTMDGAVLIGSIVMAAVVDNKPVAEGFKHLMKEAFDGFISEYYGAKIEHYEERSAPEHEKAGHA